VCSLDAGPVRSTSSGHRTTLTRVRHFVVPGSWKLSALQATSQSQTMHLLVSFRIFKRQLIEQYEV
jgi:hypothetical protein